ncbi:MAG: hypothetical protein J5877_00270 [Clostridia bacterium]|nr:hypothetical protein [Clostridia bacterium]
MKTGKRIKFNPKSGMALPAVIVILLIVSLLGTAMYAYSYDSLKAIRYASNAKKADYLARSGVEAAAFAYQMVEDNDLHVSSVAPFLTAAGVNGAEITSNEVYLVWAGPRSGEDTTSGGYKFVTKEQKSSYEERNIIGFYTVTMKNVSKTESITLKSYLEDGTSTTGSEPKSISSNIKLITAKGVAGDATKTMKGWISDATVSSSLYYGANGIIDGAYTDEVSNSYNAKTQGTEKLIKAGQYTHTSNIQMKFKWLSALGIQPITLSSGTRTIPFGVAYSAGNMILEKPDDTGVIQLAGGQTVTDESGNSTTYAGQDNLVSFVSLENIFVRAGINAESASGYFNNLTLKGKTIVIDGDVEMSAYGVGLTKNNALTWSTNSTLYSDLSNAKYRYGTVSICSLDGYSARNGYTEAPYNYASSGKVFFGGNVYVNITMPNVGTYRYRAFSAGDVYYFDSKYQIAHQYNANMIDTTGGKTVTTGSIDLFRYFLEKSIATNRYSKNVLNRFANIIEFYYGNTDTSGDNSTDEKPNQRIITVTEGTKKYAVGLYVKYEITDGTDILTSNGKITYDAMRKISEKSPYNDSLTEMVPPSASNASALHWGEPSND